MARKRFVDPGMWTDEEFGELGVFERLTFVGCVSLADDEGRLRGSPAYLRAELFPYDHDLTDRKMRNARDNIVTTMTNVVLYADEKQREYIAFTKWSDYQKPSHPTASKLPSPPADLASDSGKASENGSRTTYVSPSLPTSEKPSSLGWDG